MADINMQVIPVINVNSFAELKKKVRLIEPIIDPARGGFGWVQLDVADGTFTKNTIWHNAIDLLGFETTLMLEVHLMLADIETRVDDWLIAPIKRVIFHLETAKDPYLVIEKCRKAGISVGIAIGPNTDWAKLMPFCGKVDVFQILAVQPGLAGQQFIEESLNKITYLKQNCPNTVIEVDGGVNKEVAKRVAEAGADIVNAANYIFGAPDIKKAIEELKG